MKMAQAVRLAGSKAALAALLGVTTGAVSHWGDAVPARRLAQLQGLRPGWFEAADEAADVAFDEVEPLVCVIAPVPVWPCGAPRSTGNGFCWRDGKPSIFWSEDAQRLWMQKQAQKPRKGRAAPPSTAQEKVQRVLAETVFSELSRAPGRKAQLAAGGMA